MDVELVVSNDFLLMELNGSLILTFLQPAISSVIKIPFPLLFSQHYTVDLLSKTMFPHGLTGPIPYTCQLFFFFFQRNLSFRNISTFRITSTSHKRMLGNQGDHNKCM